MIGRRRLPQSYERWNEQWGAPFGDSNALQIPLRDKLQSSDPTRFGLFGFQGNNSTRIVEYPWAYLFGQVSAEMNVIEIGGGLSGFQFVLSREGCRVTNVDPGTDRGQAWTGAAEDHALLNKAFRTDVELYLGYLDDYGGEPESVDRVFCISVIEHVGDESALAIMKNVERLLRPGGLCVMTIDLLLDLYPFTETLMNQVGSNVSVRDLAEATALSLVFGYKEELFGFSEFNAETIRQRIPEFLVGDFHIPVAAQLLVLRKPH